MICMVCGQTIRVAATGGLVQHAFSTQVHEAVRELLTEEQQKDDDVQALLKDGDGFPVVEKNKDGKSTVRP